VRAGFAPTPVSIQVHPDGKGGTYPIGTGNVTAMFARGYIEFLFKTADTPLTQEFDALSGRYDGLHLAAFAVADIERVHRRAATTGFPVRPPVHMQRAVDSESGPQTAAFSIMRAEPGAMPEGRIQILTHHTEQAVWQRRWLSHPNTAVGLIDLVIAVADVEEAIGRFARFTGRSAAPAKGGALLRLDRGGILFATHDALTELLPEITVTTLPFIAGYAVRVQSLATAEKVAEQGDLEWRALDAGMVAAFPAALGAGAWFFVEYAAALPWRS